MVKQLRALDALPENLGLSPGTKMVTQSQLQLQFQGLQPSSALLRNMARNMCMDTYAGKHPYTKK